jgi:asparagine synthase (glutamine-hydrolysing)
LTYLPGDLMTKVDVASMAHGLECRQPYLDHRVVELAGAMPVRWKYYRGRGKRILRRAFGDLLPNDIWRRRKMGFGVPLDHWFRNELAEMTNDLLLGRQFRERGYFRPEAVQRLVTEHQTGMFDHGYRLWALLVLELWQRRWGWAVDSQPA